jgi:hypothetical protein
MDPIVETRAVGAVRGSEMHIAAASSDASEDALAHNDRQGLAGDPLSAAVHAPSEPSVRLFRVPEPFEAAIWTFTDGSFQLDKDGREAVLVSVELDGGVEIDTCAFFPNRPKRWWREFLVATHLGDQALRHAQFLGRSVRLLTTPQDWIVSPEGAMVVLDWRCDLRALFGDVPEIQCASEAMKKYLQTRLAAQVAHSYRITVAA